MYTCVCVCVCTRTVCLEKYLKVYTLYKVITVMTVIVRILFLLGYVHSFLMHSFPMHMYCFCDNKSLKVILLQTAFHF